MKWPWDKEAPQPNGESAIRTSVITRSQMRDLLNRIDHVLTRAEEKLGGDDYGKSGD